jgi:hypothetical protein
MNQNFRPDATQLVTPSDSQDRAFKTAVGLLQRAVADLSRYNPPGNSKGFQLLESRSNHVIFISGKRGSGKTSLLLRLYEKTKIIESLRNRLVWLNTIDLERMDHAGNLLASILVRFERVLEGHQNHEINRAFRHIQTEVSLAWGDLVSAAGSDADTRSVEAIRWERANLVFMSKFEELLQSISKEVFANPANGPVDPIFILPVDDCDLNPQRGLSLLRLIRKMSHPRLVFLVLGDMDLVLRLNQLYYSSQIAEMAGRAIEREDLLSTEIKSLNSYIQGLASDAFVKLVPPHQCLRLEDLDLLKASCFRPTFPDEPNVKRIGDFLSQMTVELGTPVPNVGTAEPATELTLSQYLSIPYPDLNPETKLETAVPQKAINGSKLGSKSPEPKGKNLELSLHNHHRQKFNQNANQDIRLSLPYLGQQLLKTTPRRLVDLWFEMSRIHHEAQPSAKADSQTVKINLENTIAFLENGLRSALISDGRLSSGKRQEALSTWFDRDHLGRLMLSLPDVELVPIVTNTKNINDSQHSKFSVGWGVSLELRFLEETLSPEISGWLATLHDVLSLCRRRGLIDAPLPRRIVNSSWTADVLSLLDPVHAVSKEAIDVISRPHRTIRSFQLSFFVWSHLVRELQREVKTSEGYLNLWLAAQLSPASFDHGIPGEVAQLRQESIESRLKGWIYNLAHRYHLDSPDQQAAYQHSIVEYLEIVKVICGLQVNKPDKWVESPLLQHPYQENQSELLGVYLSKILEPKKDPDSKEKMRPKKTRP